MNSSDPKNFDVNVSNLTVRYECRKCYHQSGDDWEQCGGKCPVKGSPHFHQETNNRYGDLMIVERS